MTQPFTVALLLLGLLCAPMGRTEAPEHIRLYTEPDPEAKGGITGRITDPEEEILRILAIPPDAPKLVYRGTLSGTKNTTFTFTGLPMRKYDLIVIYENKFFEGLQLNRGQDTLTEKDREQIHATIQKSEPYFPYKKVHRLEGTTGQGNTARAICTYLRAEKSEALFAQEADGTWTKDQPRRTFKIVVFKQVGPGWQITRARDLYPIWTTRTSMNPKHFPHKKLSRVRVTDHVKDLGPIELL